MEKTISGETQRKGLSTKQIALIGLMTAVTCVAGPLAIPIPFSPVPISFTNLVIYLALYVLGMKAGTLSYLVYLLLGFAGLPVFSGFSGGVAKVAGPTGGYLVGFIFLAIVTGFLFDHSSGNRVIEVVGMVIGLEICYIFGTVWLSAQLGRTFIEGLSVGVIPYLPGDAVKIILAVAFGPRLRREVRRLDR